MPGNPLHAEVTGDSSDYVSAVERARGSTERLSEQATDTGVSVQMLKGRLDAVEDEMSDAGRSATSASVRFGALSLSSGSLTASLLTLGAAGSVTTASLVALSTTLIPLAAVVGTLTAGLGSLVAVFGGLTAIGAATHMNRLKDAFAEAKAEIERLIQPLGKVFGPLLVDAVKALPTLVSRVLDAIGPVGEFRSAVVEFGAIAMEVIPAVAGTLVDLARMALPALESLVDAVRNNAGEAFGSMMEITRELSPELLALGDAVVAVVPPATRLGTAILDTLLPAVTTGVELLGRLIETVNTLALESNAARDTLVQVGTTISDTVAGAVDAATVAWNDHGAAVTGVARRSYQSARSVIGTAVDRVRSVVDGALARVRSLWRVHGDSIERLAARAYDAITAEARKVLQEGGTPVVAGALGLTLSAFRENWSEIKSVVQTAVDEIDATLSTVSGTLETQLLRPLTNSKSRLRQTMNAMYREVRTTFNLIERTVSEVMKAVLSRFIRPTLRKVSRLFQRHLSGENGIVHNARTAFTTLQNNIVKPTLDAIQTLWKKFDSDVLKIVRGTMGTLTTIVSVGMDAILTGVNVVLDLLSGDFEGAWTSIKGFTRRTWTEIATWLRTSGKTLVDGAVGVLVSAVKLPFKALYHWLFGNSLMKDLIRDPASWLQNTGKRTINSAVRTVVSAIRSPFTSVYDWVNGTLIKNLINNPANWLQTTGKSRIGTAASKISGRIKSVLGGLGGWMEDEISGLGSNLKSGIKSEVNDLIEWVNSQLPDQLYIPQLTIGGQSLPLPRTEILGQTIGGGTLRVPSETIGGQTLDLPSLDSGGFVESDGLAEIHAGERVVPAAEVRRDPASGGTRTEQTINIDVDVHGNASGRDVARALRDELDAHDI